MDDCNDNNVFQIFEVKRERSCASGDSFCRRERDMWAEKRTDIFIQTYNILAEADRTDSLRVNKQSCHGEIKGDRR